MIEIISERHRESETYFRHNFTLKGESKGNGYSFPALENGEYDTEDPNYEHWKDNVQYCLNHPEEFDDEGVESETHTWIEPMKGKCKCGNILYIDGDTECDECGKWYNGFGQELLPPKYWGDGGVW